MNNTLYVANYRSRFDYLPDLDRADRLLAERYGDAARIVCHQLSDGKWYVNATAPAPSHPVVKSAPLPAIRKYLDDTKLDKGRRGPRSPRTVSADAAPRRSRRTINLF